MRCTITIKSVTTGKSIDGKLYVGNISVHNNVALFQGEFPRYKDVKLSMENVSLLKIDGHHYSSIWLRGKMNGKRRQWHVRPC